MNETPLIYPDLQVMENEIDNKLLEENLSEENETFYKALKTVIRLKAGAEELQYKFEKFSEVFNAMAVGDFSKRIDIPNRKNLFSVMGSSINSVNEELNVNVVKKQYLESCLEYIPHIAIVTDKSGSILFANALTLKILNKTTDYINRLLIANIFESRTQFGGFDPEPESLEDQPVTIQYLDISFKARMTLKKIRDKFEETDGYLYIIKKV